MLGDVIGAALPELRLQAESLMVDTCVITRAGEPGPDSIDEDTGQVPTGEPDTIYEGMCRLQRRNVQARTTSAGETEWSLSTYELQLPASVTGVLSGDGASVTSTLDPDVTDRPFTVTAVEHKTHEVMRRLSLEEVS